jgi:hypothetical protein
MAIRFNAAFLVLLAGGVPCAAFADTVAKPQLTPQVDELLHWLPVDTETLIVASGPFPLPNRADKNPKFLAVLQSIPVGLVGDVVQSQLRGHKIQLAVGGSRRFKGPKGLGLMPYEGCQILRFDDSSDDALKAALQACLKKANEAIRLEETDVAVFKEKWEEDQWSLYVARPKQGVLLYATDKGFLKQVLERMKREQRDRAFPENLPEWRHVDAHASVWAIRHYRKETAERDPSSPLRDKAAANVPDAGATGFVFWYDAKAGKVAKARYLSSAKDAVGIVTRGWHHPSEQLTPKIIEIQPGVVEISASIDDDQIGQSFVFVLLGYLGHAVYL